MTKVHKLLLAYWVILIQALTFAAHAQNISLPPGLQDGDHWTESGANLYRSSGNVGIGTTSPINLLTVASPTLAKIRLQSNFYGTYAATLENLTYYGGLNLVTASGVGENSNIAFSPGGVEKMRMMNDGRLGIGVAAPVAKLDVAGDIYAKNSTSTTEQRLYNTFTNTSNGEWLQMGWKDTTNAAVIQSKANGTGTVRPIQIFPGTADAADNQYVGIFGGGGPSVTRGAQLYLYGNEGTNTGGAVISLGVGGQFKVLHNPWTTNAMFMMDTAGKVGIGTASPTTILTLGGSDPTISTGTADAADTKRLVFAGGGAFSSARGAYVSANGNEYAGAGGDMILSAGNVAGGEMQFYTGGALRGVWDYSGNVGIIETTPTHALSVGGSILSQTDLTNSPALASAKGSYLFGDGGNLFWNMSRDGAAGNDLKIIRNWGGTASTAVTIGRNTGNVGIGTTSPGSLLEVYGNTQYSSVNFPSSASYAGFRIQQAGVNKGLLQFMGSTFGGTRGNTLEINSVAGVAQTSLIGGAEMMRIDSTGNVGIGTTSPTVKLMVHDSVDAGSDPSVAQVLKLRRVGTSAVTGLGEAVSVDLGFLWSGTDYVAGRITARTHNTNWGSALQFFTSANTGVVGGSLQERMLINNVGSVGIGNSDPVAKLDVAGDAYLKNGTSTTEQRIYNTFTNTSNGEWLQAGWKATANTFVMNTTGNGTGVSTGPARNIALQTNGGFVAIGTDTSLVVPLTINHATIPIIDYRLNGTTKSYAGVVASTDAIITGSVANDFTHRTSGGKFLWSTNAGANAHLVISSGNVGIGTASPEHKLDIYSASATEPQFRIRAQTNVNSAYGAYIWHDAAARRYDSANVEWNGTQYIPGSSTASIVRQYSGIHEWYGNTGLTAGVAYTPTLRMQLTADGNLSIGASTPGSRLDVNGGITLRDRAAMTATAAQSKLWSESGEMKVIDASGNVTTISPHPQELMDVLGVTGAAKTLGMDYTTPESGFAVAQPKARWLEWYVEIDHTNGSWTKRNFNGNEIESGQSKTLVKIK